MSTFFESAISIMFTNVPWHMTQEIYEGAFERCSRLLGSVPYQCMTNEMSEKTDLEEHYTQGYWPYMYKTCGMCKTTFEENRIALCYWWLHNPRNV